VTFYTLPQLFIAIDCLLLLIALIWICRSLKHDKHVMGNEKYMVLHSALLLMTLGGQTYLAYCYANVKRIISNDNQEELLGAALMYERSWKIFTVCNCLECLIMVFIMNQVNSP
jgi:hypothetical protein